MPTFLQKENLDLLAKTLLKYSSMGTKQAMKELMEIDFIKNNYQKTTIYTYLTRVKSFLITGRISKSAELIKHVAKLRSLQTQEQPKYLEKIANAVEQKIKNRVKTTEELIKELEEKYEEIKPKVMEVKLQITKEINRLNDKLATINKVAIEEERKILEKIEELREKQVKEILDIESEANDG